ncbi:hypothetical protein ACRCQW_11595, partial [Pseudomonas aeruginosa]
PPPPPPFTRPPPPPPRAGSEPASAPDQVRGHAREGTRSTPATERIRSAAARPSALADRARR